jgi:hypothetical protein
LAPLLAPTEWGRGAERSEAVRGIFASYAIALLSKGGDWTVALFSPIVGVARKASRSKLPISPLEGEMSGRTEEGMTSSLFGERE